MNERSLYNSIIPLFKREADFSVIEEARIFKCIAGCKNKRIDIKFQNEEEKIAIEVKLYDWEKALIQAYLNSFFVNKSYVAIWSETIKNVKLDLFKEYNVGLISVDQKHATVIFEPGVNSEKTGFHKIQRTRQKSIGEE